jgi:outer membrane protein assembly factor BamB
MTTIKQAASELPTEDMAKPAPPPRVWPAVVLIALYWTFILGLGRLDLPIFAIFMSTVAASALLTLLFSIWWLSNRTITGKERLFVFLVFVGGAVAASVFSDPSVGPMGVIFFGIPIVFSAWLVALIVTRGRSSAARRWGLAAVVVATWCLFGLARVDGIDGQNQAALSWRWADTKEQEYLRQLALGNKAAAAEPAAVDSASPPLELSAGDWPEFRGPDRLGEVHDVRIATDWNAAPPKELWRRRIGPAWSSVLIIGDRLFTQEQRGQNECVVCLDAGTGNEIWMHDDSARFSDGQAGAGPRATPTFAKGSLYSLGASGVLNCLDAVSGKSKWTRNIAADSAAPLPMWGFSSSPLVFDDLVVVYSGAPGGKGVLAYRAADGEPAWTVASGPSSYSSAQLATIHSERQILFLSDLGLVSVRPASGDVLWKYDAPGSGVWRVVQPRQIDEASILVGSEDLGLVRLEVAKDQDSWSATPSFASRALRPAYNDFVVSGDHVYGFDESIFCCVDAKTGKRKWKGGRYGHGQVLLLADQPLLLVISETGEVIFLAVNPEKHEELGRFQAIKGKTWNHPVIARGRLFTRNDEEIACFELRPAEGP